jgi:hypothetical protein
MISSPTYVLPLRLLATPSMESVPKELNAKSQPVVASEDVVLQEGVPPETLPMKGVEKQVLESKGQAREDETSKSSSDKPGNPKQTQCSTPPGSSSGRTTPTPKPPSLESKWKSFSTCRMSFAIDTSGSTMGEVLKQEQLAICDVCSLLTETARDEVSILPWSSHADPISSLLDLKSLGSYGGTQPEVLLDNFQSLAALKNSHLWFLLTDGQIPKDSLQRFAEKFASTGVHGTACVIIVFGKKQGRPSSCNISVGVSVFAVVPDCLFLFQDTNSSKTYLMQCKGRFTEILERSRKEQPVLDDCLNWEDLPQLSLKELSCVSVAAPRKLTKNEVVLEDDLVVNLDDLWSNRLNDQHVIDTILRSEENIRTISLTAQTRDQTELLRSWVIKQELDPVDFSLLNRPDPGAQARGSVNTLMQRTETGTSITGAVLQRVQAQLRKIHTSNRYTLDAYDHSVSSIVESRTSSIQQVVDRTHSDCTVGGSISLASSRIPSSNRIRAAPFNLNNDGFLSAPSSMKLCFTPGFQKSKSEDSGFQGTCALCAAEDSTLALLLKKPPSSRVTPGFPEAASKTKLAFPLAMGNFPETDIVSSFTCCDACSYIVSENGRTSSGEEIVCSLPLVSYSANKRAYHSQLQKALCDRFNEDHTPLVFIAILYTTSHRIRSSRPRNTHLLLQAIEWACRDLVCSVQCLSTLSSSFSAEGNPVVLEPLGEVLAKTSNDSLRLASTYYFQYPVEGFTIMTMALDGNRAGPQFSSTAKMTVFPRLLFHITEQFHQHLEDQGSVITHITMSQLLIQGSPGRDRSPWAVDQKKTSFRSITGLTRSLFGDRKTLTSRLSIGLELLTDTPLLKTSTLNTFRTLGSLFSWIEVKCVHAIAIFLHYLYRYKVETKSPLDHFIRLARNPTLEKVFLGPTDISARAAEKLVEALPPLDQP